MRSLYILIFSLMLPIWIGAGARCEDSADLAIRSAELVKLLGDGRFATREMATTQLIEIGWPAKSSLEAGIVSEDREIRFRSSRILSIIDEMDFQRRLTGFAAGRDDEDNSLPGWESFRERYGGESESRSLFVEMQRAEPDVMRAIAEGPRGVGKKIDARCLILQQKQRMYREAIGLGSVAAFLFAASEDGVTVDLQSGSAICSFCYQQSFTAALESNDKKNILRKMLGRWVERGEDWTAYQCLSLAMRYDLKEGLVPAVKVVKNPANQPYIRQNAVLAIAKLGDESHIELLESLLDDDARCTQQRIKNVTYEAQIRDVALAALLCMTDQDPKEFGFERYQANSTNLFITSTVGFENDAKRQKVFAKWKEFRDSQKDKS